jgi:protein-disulfide isomerase
MVEVAEANGLDWRLLPAIAVRESTGAVRTVEDLITTPIQAVSSSSVATQSGALAERVVEHGILEIGSTTAPLTLTVYTNFACKYCQEFFGSAYSSLKNDFVATGDVKIRIVIVPLKKYPNSVFESSALLCATQQKHGEAMHLALGSSVRDRKTVIALATKLGLNIKTFPTCLGTKETKATLKEQADLVTQKNVTLIPALDLNGEMKVGLQSYADLRGWILDMLKR